MHFRFFAPFAAVALAGMTAVMATPARRQLSSVETLIETTIVNATAALSPILTEVGKCTIISSATG